MSTSAFTTDTPIAHGSSSARETEAQALLVAARKLLDVHENWDSPDADLRGALSFNRRLWTIFLSAAGNDDNPQPLEVRQNVANIGIFVLNQTIEIEADPDPAKLTSLIEINCNLAAGLTGLS